MNHEIEAMPGHGLETTKATEFHASLVIIGISCFYAEDSLVTNDACNPPPRALLAAGGKMSLPPKRRG